jgi:hypothetical protein
MKKTCRAACPFHGLAGGAGARATAFEAVIFSLFLAFMLIAITLIWHDRSGESTGARNVRSIQSLDRGSAETGQLHGRAGPEMGETNPTAAPDHPKGRMVLPAAPPGAGDPGQEEVNGTIQPESEALPPLGGEKLQAPSKTR